MQDPSELFQFESDTSPGMLGELQASVLVVALGGFIDDPAWNRVTMVCFSDGDTDGDSLYTRDEVYTAGPCVNTAPTADASGPYQVFEGSTVHLDGTGSSDR